MRESNKGTVGGEAGCRWREISSYPEQERADALRSVRGLLASNAHGHIDHDPAWLAAMARSPGKRFELWIATRASEVVGYIPLFIHPSALDFEALGMTVFSYPFERLTMTGAPLLKPGEKEDELYDSLLRTLARSLSSRQVLFGLGTPRQCAFGALLESGGLGFNRLQSGAAYERRTIEFRGDFDWYMTQLGPKTRQDLRRQERRLQKQARSVSVRTYSGVGDVEHFLIAAQHVSSQTYQWHMHGLGIHNDPASRALLEVAAKAGWLRSYVMFCDDTPAAFMLGYLYNRTYESVHIGYVQQWSDYSVGNVLHLHVVRDLVQPNVNARSFDFMYGDNSNKERLSTNSRTEFNVYLFPRTVKWRLLAGSLQLFNASAAAVARFLESRGLMTRLRSYMRRRSVRSSA